MGIQSRRVLEGPCVEVFWRDWLTDSLIHRYWVINDEELYTICKENLGDFGDFVTQTDDFPRKLRSVAP